MSNIKGRLSDPQRLDLTKLTDRSLHFTLPSRLSSNDLTKYKGLPVTLKSLRQERYLKQRSVSNSPMLRDLRPLSTDVASKTAVNTHADKVAETELRWNELKKDLQKSPRATIIPQAATYFNNSEKLIQSKRSGTTIQNTNYNFFNYSINFSCSHDPFVIKDSEKSVNFRKTLDLSMPPINETVISAKPLFKGRKEPSQTKESAKKEDKLLHMVLEVKANLEGCTRKRSTTLQEDDDKALHRLSLKSRHGRNANKILKEDTNEEMTSADENIRIDTSYFKSIRDPNKPMIRTNKWGAVSERQTIIPFCEKAPEEKKYRLFKSNTLKLDNDEETSIKIPRESKQPRLINYSSVNTSPIKVRELKQTQESELNLVNKNLMKKRPVKMEQRKTNLIKKKPITTLRRPIKKDGRSTRLLKTKTPFI